MKKYLLAEEITLHLEEKELTSIATPLVSKISFIQKAACNAHKQAAHYNQQNSRAHNHLKVEGLKKSKK